MAVVFIDALANLTMLNYFKKALGIDVRKLPQVNLIPDALFYNLISFASLKAPYAPFSEK